MRKLHLLAIVACAAVAAAAAAQTATARANATTSLTIYSGREERLVKPLFDRFTKETGIALNVRYGSSAEMAATILEEGDNSRADVFFAQEAGLLGFVAREGMLKVLPESTLTRVGRSETRELKQPVQSMSAISPMRSTRACAQRVRRRCRRHQQARLREL